MLEISVNGERKSLPESLVLEKAMQECENNAPVLKSSESVNLSRSVYPVDDCKEEVKQRLE